jgi:hypothetical protein
MFRAPLVHADAAECAALEGNCARAAQEMREAIKALSVLALGLANMIVANGAAAPSEPHTPALVRAPLTLLETGQSVGRGFTRLWSEAICSAILRIGSLSIGHHLLSLLGHTATVAASVDGGPA